MTKSVKQRLMEHELILVMSLAQARTADVVMIAAASGYDAIWVDLEHTATSLETTSMLCSTAIARGLGTFVRVPSHDHQYLTRALDTGAQGVVVPHVDTVEEAERIVSTCRFPPLGHRSIIGPNPVNGYRAMSHVELVEFSNQATILTAMLETPAAIERADEIAAVAGIDMILVGPADLTAEMGILGEYRNERFSKAIERVAAACRRHSKAFGIAGMKDVALLTEMIGMGLRFINVGNDTGYLMEAARANLDRVRAIPVPASR